MSTQRKLMLLALTIHLISLFFLYADNAYMNSVPMSTPSGRTVMFDTYSQEATGFKVKPVAVYIIIVLMLAYLSKICEDPAWKRWGYWGSLAALIFFGVGGAVIRTTGGKLSLISIGIVLIAAYINMSANRPKPKSPVA